MSVVAIKRVVTAGLFIPVMWVATDSFAKTQEYSGDTPIGWLMKKANVTQKELNRSNVSKGAQGTAFRVNNIEGSSIENKKVFSLRVSDVTHIQELEEEVQNLYGRPDEKTENSRVWYVKDANSVGYVLEIVDHPAGPKLISAHEGATKTSTLRKMSRQKKRGKFLGKNQ